LEGIEAGTGDGLVERARVRIGYRVPPGMDLGELEGAAAMLARNDGDTRIAVTTQGREEPVRTPRTSPLARAFTRAIVAAGGQTMFKEKSGTSDMNILFPAWRCPMVAYGPGDSRYDHTPIERLSIADFARSINVLKGVLSRASDRII
jgi:LysW-gamma-L-lysine carboxypeptidase